MSSSLNQGNEMITEFHFPVSFPDDYLIQLKMKQTKTEHLLKKKKNDAKVLFCFLVCQLSNVYE